MSDYPKPSTLCIYFDSENLQVLHGLGGELGLKCWNQLVGGVDTGCWDVRLQAGRNTVSVLIPQMQAPAHGPAVVDVLAWGAMVAAAFPWGVRYGRLNHWAMAWGNHNKFQYDNARKSSRKLNRFLGEENYVKLRALGFLPLALMRQLNPEGI